LRDSGVDVVIGNLADAWGARGSADGFEVRDIAKAVRDADVVMLLIPDEVMPEVYERDVRPHQKDGSALVFASGYNVAFGHIQPPPGIDVLLIAPRMIGPGVRDTY